MSATSPSAFLAIAGLQMRNAEVAPGE